MLSIFKTYILKSKYFGFLLIIQVMDVCCKLAQPLLLSLILSSLTAGTVVFSKTLSLVCLTAVLELIKEILAYWSNIYNCKLQTSAAFKLNMNILDHVETLPMSFFCKNRR